MSYAKLRGKIKEVFNTQEVFASELGIDLSSLSQKLNNKTPWKREEIERASVLLGIPIEQVHEYFFSKKSWEIPTSDM